jgi:elongation of very long chain fatty acids protein 6
MFLNATTTHVLTVRNDFSMYNDMHDFWYKNRAALATIAALYLPMIFGIRSQMRQRSPMRGGVLDLLFFAWNMTLSVLSGVGAFIMIPVALADFQKHGSLAVCTGNMFLNEYTAFVTVLFNLSKFFEFVDTLFVVTRKSQLEFLHWYHHILTCIYCWHASYVAVTTGPLFATMNLFVHAIMYFYYGLYAIDVKVLYPFRKLITLIQISQMVGGCAILYTWFNSCERKNPAETVNHIIAAGMYFSYFILFVKIFFREKKKTA